MSLSELLQKWYADCKAYYKEVYNGNFSFEPIDGPRIGFVRAGEIDRNRLIKTRNGYLSNR